MVWVIEKNKSKIFVIFKWIARPIATYLRYLDGRLAGFT